MPRQKVNKHKSEGDWKDCVSGGSECLIPLDFSPCHCAAQSNECPLYVLLKPIKENLKGHTIHTLVKVHFRGLKRWYYVKITALCKVCKIRCNVFLNQLVNPTESSFYFLTDKLDLHTTSQICPRCGGSMQGVKGNYPPPPFSRGISLAGEDLQEFNNCFH